MTTTAESAIDLTPFERPLQRASAAVRAAVVSGIQHADPSDDPAPFALLASAEAPANEVRRYPDGRIRITCLTKMPNVTPAMIDWWFGWHMPATRRYRLWHPVAHLRSELREPQTSAIARERYIGFTSLVDEYIGPAMGKLAIAFQEPSTFGFPPLGDANATAVCAYTSDRRANGRGGKLVHYVVAVPGGSEMRSGFWLGEIVHDVPLVRALAGRLLNSPQVRRRFVTDRFALDLLTHCGEEMPHLAGFLPELYAEAKRVGEA